MSLENLIEVTRIFFLNHDTIAPTSDEREDEGITEPVPFDLMHLKWHVADQLEAATLSEVASYLREAAEAGRPWPMSQEAQVSSAFCYTESLGDDWQVNLAYIVSGVVIQALAADPDVMAADVMRRTRVSS